jgi:hypothetical protein
MQTGNHDADAPEPVIVPGASETHVNTHATRA